MKTLFALLPCFMLSLNTTLPAQSAGGEWQTVGEIRGTANDQRLGASMAVGSDMDGDGYPELAIGFGGPTYYGGYSLGGVELHSGKTGNLLWQYVPRSLPNGPFIGDEISFIPDLTGDGVADIISGAEYADSSRGQVTILNGVTGAAVRVHLGILSPINWVEERLGGNVLGIADIDNDGYGDYLYTARGSDGLAGELLAGRVDCVSGKTGQVVWSAYGAASWDKLGWAMCLGPDLNGDGHADVFVSSVSETTVYLFDSVAGQELQAYVEQGPVSGSFGWSLALGPDLDNDGFEDLLVGAAFADTPSGNDSGYLTLISSNSGQDLWRHDGEFLGFTLGQTVSNVGDLNQDGVPDLASFLIGTNGSFFRIFSGANGSSLWRIDEPAGSGTFGSSICAFDYTGDGIFDLLIGSPNWSTAYVGGSQVGRVTTHSFSPFLYRESSSLSASAPSPLSLRLDFPASEAAKPFAILASATGNTPTLMHGLEVPLVVDTYFHFTVQTPPSKFRGLLDANGNAMVQVLVPPSYLTSIAGSTLYFAAVTAGGGQPRLSSAAVPVSVVQ